MHSKNIIHRDLKPENILIDQLAEGVNIVKIGDFGIAKVEIKKAENKYTGTLGSLTTPKYLAPEMRGKE